MNILVTGAAGFLAGECIRQLQQAGHRIITTDKRGTPDLKGDLTDEQFCRTLPDVDAVVHSAAVQYVSSDLPLLQRESYFDRNNVVATRNLVDRYTRTGTHFVNIGTSMMYEQSGQDVYDTSSRMRGQGPYSTSKIQAQALVDGMPDPTACIIPCIIAGDGRGGLFQSLVNSMLRFGVACYPGDGRHKIHTVHVSDAAALVTTVIQTRASGRFNAASAEPLSIADWVDEISSELGLDRIRTILLPLKPIELLSVAMGYRLLAQEQLLMLRFQHVLSIREGLALGWTPRYTNAGIVRETARALAHRG
jgi:nucleoside-diphosphate-sugar epimerase